MSDSSAQTELKLGIPRRFYGGGRAERIGRMSEQGSKMYRYLAKYCESIQHVEELDFCPEDYFDWVSEKTWPHATTSLGLPQIEHHRIVLEVENLKTQLIAERR